MSKRLVVALSGGVGGAKLALGLSRVLPADELLVVANTGDDFEHLGLCISPDIDTLTYALAGIDNPATGWGRRDETWSFMDSIGALGGEDWFRLGDRDLALHVERTRRLRLGQTLSEVTADICRRLGIGARVVPMSDDRVRTRVRGDAGWIDFQDYFVRQQCRPVVHELAFDGVTLARPQADITAALRSGDVRAVIVCPSNPFISVEPILAIPGMRDAIKASGAPVVAVSPIIGGQAVKGPTAKMMRELGLEVSAGGVAARYGDLLDGYIVDHADADGIGNISARVTIAKTLMTSLQDRETLARVTLDAADALASHDERHLGGHSGQGVRWRQASAVDPAVAARTPAARRDHAHGHARCGCRLPASGRRDDRYARSRCDGSRQEDRCADRDRGGAGWTYRQRERRTPTSRGRRACRHDHDARRHSSHSAPAR